MMPRSRLTIALYLVLVFASGVLVGVVSHRLYATTSTASANNSPQTLTEFRRRYIEGMRKEVGATEAQLAEISKILDDTRKKVNELAAAEKPLHDKIQQEHIDQIKELLNPQQRIAYENWRAARERAKRLAEQSKK
jgi:peptidoglycan hydrolase CwlO-like protein